jgi:hypothetical protein
MGGAKRIAMVVRDRQGEALRVASGLTLADDAIEVFVLDRQLDTEDPEVARPLELVNELDLKVWSNNASNGFAALTLEEMARKFLEYDLVISY